MTICWRCRVMEAPVPEGVACPSCRAALMLEYEAERARRGVRYLYLTERTEPLPVGPPDVRVPDFATWWSGAPELQAGDA
jgi:hypothetical protein